MSFSEASNLEEAVAFLKVAYQEAVSYDEEFSSSFSSDPSDSYGIQALYESRSHWGVFQHAQELVKSLGGDFSYELDLANCGEVVVVRDPQGESLWTYPM
jgi:hypothetical protein